MQMLNSGGAQCNATPDVCKVPTPGGPVPTPFPNLGTTQMADPGGLVQKVLVANMPAMNLMSKVTMTNGDQGGSIGGIASNRIMGQVQFLQGSTKVMVGGKPALRVGVPTGQNGAPANSVGTVVSPSQVKVMVMS